MKIVNVKVANIRPKYNNLKEWMDDENNIYIGRKGIVFIDGIRFPKKDSLWCNPFKIPKSSKESKTSDERERNEVLEKYKVYIKNKLSLSSSEEIEGEKLINELLKLKGKTLGCWCKPEKCHGDILIELIKEYDS